MTDVNTTGSDSKLIKRQLTIRSVQGLPRDIKSKLSAKRKELFKATVFGHWLDFDYDPPESGLVDIVLQQRVKEDVPHQLIFKVGNQESYFRRQEFSIMTGFKFGTEQSLDEMDAGARTSRIRELFKSTTGSLKILQLEKHFYNDKKFKNVTDFDAVTICLLLLLLLFFEGRRKEAVVPDNYIKLVEDRDRFNSFPWGSHLWDKTFPDLDIASKDIKVSSSISLDGFAYAFQMWIFEVFPVARKFSFSRKEGSKDVIPRAIKWKRKKNTGRDWQNFFKEEFTKVDIVENLTPTNAEASCDWWIDTLMFFDDTDDSIPICVPKLEDMVSERDAQISEKDARIALLEASLASLEESSAFSQLYTLALEESIRSLRPPPRFPFGIPVTWPPHGPITLDWVNLLMFKLDWASKNLEPHELPKVLPKDVIEKLVSKATNFFIKEANCVRVEPKSDDSVVVVGDLHGQLHDLLFLLKKAKLPCSNRFYVFNGDYVDRGAWGVETFVTLLAWKVLLPKRVFLLRGNHETSSCTATYGFEKEVSAKYGDDGAEVYSCFEECFTVLPIASLIANRVFTSHGGLFRKDKKKTLSIGSLEDLKNVNRFVYDPYLDVVGDVLWSDPKLEDGLSLNEQRQLGLLWGPDCTEKFLKSSGCKLIIRSHEGPDAREGRDGFRGMDEGYTIDHVVPSGKLVTVFSAPDYPQFQLTMDRYNNQGAYILLKHPNFHECNFFSFDAVIPRPSWPREAYYNLNDPDSDAEIDKDKFKQESGSDGSDDSDVQVDLDNKMKSLEI